MPASTSQYHKYLINQRIVYNLASRPADRPEYLSVFPKRPDFVHLHMSNAKRDKTAKVYWP